MKKLIYFFVIVLIFGCSKNDESSKTFDTFLDKYNGTSWTNEDGLIISFSNEIYFMSMIADTSFPDEECFKLKEGNQIPDNGMTLEIIKNEPNLLVFEMKFINGNLFSKDRITANEGVLIYEEIIFEDGVGYNSATNLTKTNASYSDFCD